MTPRRNTTTGSKQHPKAPKGGSKGGDGKKTGKGK